MQQIKAITDYGILPVRVIGAKKEISGEFWAVCEVPTKYMNAKYRTSKSNYTSRWRTLFDT